MHATSDAPPPLHPRPAAAATLLGWLAAVLVAASAPGVAGDDPPGSAPPDGEAAGAGLPVAAPPPGAAGETDPLQDVGMAGLQEAFRALRSSYIRRDSLTPVEMNRAALAGLLDRLDFGADLVGSTDAGLPFQPEFRTGRLPGGIGYLRPVRFDAAESEELRGELEALHDTDVETLVLDLRCPAGAGDFGVAARIADLFVGQDTPLFQIVRPGESRPRAYVAGEPRVWDRPVILLVDADTPPVAEVVAAVLDRQVAPFVVGSKTAGRTVEYQEFALAEGVELKVASAEVVLPDGASLFRSGVTPDLSVPPDPAGKAAFFTAGDQAPTGQFVYESERPRLNEAALVAGTNPELPYLILRSAQRPTPYDEPPVVDRVLQQVVDLLATSQFLGEQDGGGDVPAGEDTP